MQKYKKMTHQEELDLRELCYLKWERNPKIRSEFMSKEAYASYTVAVAKGIVREYTR